jgi:hypothetical protein
MGRISSGDWLDFALIIIEKEHCVPKAATKNMLIINIRILFTGEWYLTASLEYHRTKCRKNRTPKLQAHAAQNCSLKFSNSGISL